MLQLLLGYSGTGKTEYLFERLPQLTESGEVLFIVPEQFSFETEKKLFDLLGLEKFHKVEVLSFSRLAEMVFRTYGGVANNYITDTTRLAKLFLATKSVKDHLQFYKNQVGKEQFSKKLLEMLKETKTLGVTYKELYEAALLANDKDLAEKIKELTLIFEAYDSFILDKYIDPIDNLNRCFEKLKEEQGNFFSQKTVILDQFTGFNAAQYNILSEMLLGAKEVLVTLGVEDIYTKEILPGFTPMQQTGQHLFSLARKLNVPVNKPQVFAKNLRAKTESLQHLNKMLVTAKKTEVALNDDGIQLVKGKNKYDTLKFVAAKIDELTKSGGYRYRDIVVVTRDLPGYQKALERTFSDYKIPVFTDESQKAANKPIVSFIENVLAVLNLNFQSEDVLGLLKSGLLPFNQKQILDFERYVFVWSIEKSAFFEDFTNHPNGFGQSFTEEDTVLLEEINETRKALIEPLRELKEQTKRKQGREIVRALYRYCEDLKIDEQAVQTGQDLEELGFLPQSVLVQKMWDTVVEIFEQLYSGFSEEVCTLDEFSRLFHLICEDFQLGEIPQTADQVVFSQIDRAVLNNPKVVIVLGANLGEYPKTVNETSLLAARERILLKEAGISFIQNEDDMVLDEMYYGYKALSAPSEKLILTYETGGLDNEKKLPSKLVFDVKDCFTNLDIENTDQFDNLFYLSDKDTAFEILCKEYKRENTFTVSLLEAFQGDDQFREQITLLERIKENTPYLLQDKELIERTYGQSINLSPTRMDNFQKCRFSYFLENTLKVKPLEKAAVNYRELGSFVHFISYKVLSDMGQDFYSADEKTLKTKVEKTAKEYFESYFQNAELGQQNRYLLKVMTDNSLLFLLRVQTEINTGNFKVNDLEVKIEKGGDIQPFSVYYKDREIFVRGVVDRIDISKTENKNLVRIIDYKTGQKGFEYKNVYYGLDLQLLLYLFAVLNDKNRKQGDTAPAAALYMPATVGLEEGDSSSEKNLKENFKMSGLVLEDESVLSALGGKTPFVKVKPYKGERGQALVGKEDLLALQSHVETTLQGVAEKMLNGDIQALPLVDSDTSPCDYCPYRFVCKIEGDDPVEQMENLKKEEILKKLREGEENGASEMDKSPATSH